LLSKNQNAAAVMAQRRFTRWHNILWRDRKLAQPIVVRNGIGAVRAEFFEFCDVHQILPGGTCDDRDGRNGNALRLAQRLDTHLPAPRGAQRTQPA
jgi:hypothetical protein